VTAPGGRPWRIERDTDGYPSSLLDLDDIPDRDDAPQTLYGVGRREAVAGLDKREAVTVVGARRSSSYGRAVAEDLCELLAAAGITVISGMAYGIDAAAHRGALAGGGTTIAVLAGGPDYVYPPSARRLYRRILASGGAAISELEPGVRPARWGFPARNRLMAALSATTVVVEAAERSGSRITATDANKLNRDVGAVPGPVTSRLSAGPHALISDGAKIIRDAQDVLDLLLGVGATSVGRSGPRLEPELAPALGAVEAGAGTCDAVTKATGAVPHDAAVALARLELLGYVRVDGSGRYVRTALAAPEAASQPAS
jgi:DNA processing protein